jgi:hypothetical protein
MAVTVLRRFILVWCSLWLTFPIVIEAYQSPLRRWSHDLKTGYKQRIAADPSFPAKSITELILAAGSQLTAEWNQRGSSRLLPEIDFVTPGVLTAVFGKYYR